MAELNKIISERLATAFGNDTQDVTARKLSMTQGNVSKLVNGEQMPTVDTLVEVSKAYNVSVDWLVGVSDCPEIDGLVIEKLTYKQIALVIDKLIENCTVEIPDLVVEAEANGIYIPEEPEEGEDPPEKMQPIIDSDHIKIRDRILSYLLRRRMKLTEIDAEMHDVWIEKLANFQELRLLTYSLLMQEAIDANKTAGFKDGDWVELAQRFLDLTDDELQEEITRLKEEDGNKNGR